MAESIYEASSLDFHGTAVLKQFITKSEVVELT